MTRSPAIRATVLALLVFPVLGLRALSAVHGEHGMPGYSFAFGDGDVLPTNTLVPLHGYNGVPFGLSELAARKPRLVADKHVVALEIVDSYDDMEGHAKPFPDDGGGYGQNLILMAPKKRLKPATTYRLTLEAHRKGQPRMDLTTLTTGRTADTRAPRWRRAPTLKPADARDPMPSTIVTAIDDVGKLPFFVIIDLTPLDAGAVRKRMIATLHGAAGADSEANDDGDNGDEGGNCDRVTVYDHALGVFGDDTDRSTGRRYAVRLTAVDMAGNRRRAPGKRLSVVWNGGLTICNNPAYVPVRAARIPAAPRWLGAPRSQVRKATAAGSRDTAVITMPVVTDTAVYVELIARPADKTRPRLRYLALLESTAVPDRGKCARADITNDDRDKSMPAGTKRVAVRATLIDPLGRRFKQKTPALLIARDAAERLEVCFEAEPLAPRASD